MGQGRGVRMGDGGREGELSEIPRGTLVCPQHLWGQCQSLTHSEVQLIGNGVKGARHNLEKEPRTPAFWGQVHLLVGPHSHFAYNWFFSGPARGSAGGSFWHTAGPPGEPCSSSKLGPCPWKALGPVSPWPAMKGGRGRAGRHRPSPALTGSWR